MWVALFALAVDLFLEFFEVALEIDDRQLFAMPFLGQCRELRFDIGDPVLQGVLTLGLDGHFGFQSIDRVDQLADLALLLQQPRRHALV